MSVFPLCLAADFLKTLHQFLGVGSLGFANGGKVDALFEGPLGPKFRYHLLDFLPLLQSVLFESVDVVESDLETVVKNSAGLFEGVIPGHEDEIDFLDELLKLGFIAVEYLLVEVEGLEDALFSGVFFRSVLIRRLVFQH